MKYNNPELIERLSAEYVLGTLQGKARDRFQRLMEGSHRIRLAVWAWENHITPMATASPAALAPEDIWHGIRLRLGHGQRQKLTLSHYFWKFWGLTATAASLVLSLLLVSQYSDSLPSFDRVALFSNQESEPQWLVSFDMDSGQLKAKALNAIALEAGRAFELWVLPETGNPQSLGLLPVSSNTNAALNTALPQALIELLQSANGLAISVEPAGGSPTGLPTGPVVFQSAIINL